MTLKGLAGVFVAATLLLFGDTGIGVAEAYSDPLNAEEIAMVRSIIAKTEPIVEKARDNGHAALLDWATLYAPLNAEERAFIDHLRHPATFGPPPEVQLIALTPVTLQTADGPLEIAVQYLPEPTLLAYQNMMQAMHQDIGRSLLIESGHRSPAYQAYLFVYYMKNHDYSIPETRRFVALPGTSEHGDVTRQAIDFITQDGVNGDGNPEAFEVTPEFQWLQRYAGNYGFTLSYPKETADSAYEPWHWHHRAD